MKEKTLGLSRTRGNPVNKKIYWFKAHLYFESNSFDILMTMHVFASFCLQAMTVQLQIPFCTL